MDILNQLIVKDPLGKFVLHKLKLTPFLFALLTLLYFVIFLPAGNSYIQKTYSGQYIGLFDNDELLNAIASFIIFFPVAAWFYTWQLAATKKLFSTLVSDKVIVHSEEDFSAKVIGPYFESKLIDPLTDSHLHLLSLAISIASMTVFTISAFQDKVVGEARWFTIYAWLYFVFYLPPQIISTYAMALAVMRHIVIVRFINRIFSDFDVIVRPLHPDKAGGFSPVSRFAASSSVVAITIGIWINVLIFAPTVFGDPPSLTAHIGLYPIYIALTPLLLILPVTKASKVMTEAKHSELRKVSAAFESFFAQCQRELNDAAVATDGNIQQNDGIIQAKESIPDNLSLSEQNKTLEELEQRYQFIERTFPTSPFSRIEIRGLTLSSIAPLVPGFLLGIAELYFKTKNSGQTG